MTSHRARTIQAGSLAFIFAGSGCGLILGLDDFEDASATGRQSSGGAGGSGGADGAGGAGGSGGAGGAGTCRPEIAERCYSGPPGTEAVGLCRAGIRTCDDSGEMWGTCEDEVTPQQESCASTEDENCDGFDCTLWARAFAKDAQIHSVATDTSGNIFLVGHFKESIQFDTEPGSASLMGAGETDIFVASIDKLGQHRWSHEFGDVAAQEASSVAVDSAGNAIVIGTNDGTINLDGLNLGPGLFIAKFDNEGKHIWSRSFPGNPINNDTTRPKVNTTQHDNIIISGTFENYIELDNETLTTEPATPENTRDIYVAKLDGSTGHTSTSHGGWVRQFSSRGVDTLVDAAVDRSDNVVLVGHHNAEIVLGNLPPIDGSGMFLTKLDRNGDAAWGRGFENAHPSALDVDTLGNISVTGSYEGSSFSFEAGSPLPEGRAPLFVAQFNTTGDHKWSRGFTSLQSTGPQVLSSDVSIDQLNNVVIVCTIARNILVDNEILDPSERQYALALKINSVGSTMWKRTYTAGLAYGSIIETDLSNESIIAGRFSLQMHLETGTLDTGEQYIDDISPFITKIGF
ncbi:hypothetical protein WMF31_31950 [Sorangium sp. So ce1036]|uniref:hypothetical protein n=1 Tax=Sorangium sp. So ce1036 TaxID=3133328 RepID=UPI003F0FED78